MRFTEVGTTWKILWEKNDPAELYMGPANHIKYVQVGCVNEQGQEVWQEVQELTQEQQDSPLRISPPRDDPVDNIITTVHCPQVEIEKSKKLNRRAKRETPISLYNWPEEESVMSDISNISGLSDILPKPSSTFQLVETEPYKWKVNGPGFNNLSLNISDMEPPMRSVSAEHVIEMGEKWELNKELSPTLKANYLLDKVSRMIPDAKLSVCGDGRATMVTAKYNLTPKKAGSTRSFGSSVQIISPERSRDVTSKFRGVPPVASQIFGVRWSVEDEFGKVFLNLKGHQKAKQMQAEMGYTNSMWSRKRQLIPVIRKLDMSPAKSLRSVKSKSNCATSPTSSPSVSLAERTTDPDYDPSRFE